MVRWHSVLLAGSSLLAIEAALSLSQPVAAQTTVSTAVAGPQNWTTGNFTVTNSGTISNTSTNGVGIDATGSLGDLTMQGLIAISGSSSGVAANYPAGVRANANTTIGTIANSGTITSSHFGILNRTSTSTITAIDNAVGGLIRGGGGNNGIYNLGTIGVITNSGTVSSTDNTAIVNSTILGTLINNSTGTLQGGTSGQGFFNNGSVTSISNAGLIAGGTNQAGLENIGTITSLTNGGTISGSGTNAGFYNYSGGSIASLTNSGRISGGNTGVNNGFSGTASIGTLTNSGIISGSAYGVWNGSNAGTIGALNNSGTIAGPTDAILNSAGGSLGPIANSGVIAGNILNSSTNALTIAGGAGGTYGLLTGYNGGTPSLASPGTIGTITSTSANLVFSGGNLLLNDAVNVGSGTVSNSGATLKFVSPIAVTGNYSQSGGTLQWGASVDFSVSGAFTLGSGGATFDTNGFSTTLASAIGGSGAVTKVGSGTLTLSAANSYSGGTTITGGTLKLAAGASLASGSALAVNGGTFDLNGNSQTFGRLSGTGGTIALGSGTLTAGDGSDTTLAAAITGTGRFVKQGTGTMTLAGANSYSGGTTISAGTLKGDSTSLQGDIANNAALVFDQDGDGTYDGVISGSGTLSKLGSGRLILNGVNTMTGLTSVGEGVLQLGDESHPEARLAGSVFVGAGATLAGYGTIGGDLVNTAGGTVWPGSYAAAGYDENAAPGTLRILGNYTQGPGSTLHIVVTPRGASGLAVSGRASLDGTLALVYAPGVHEGDDFTFLTAGELTGNFDEVTSSGWSGGAVTFVNGTLVVSAGDGSGSFAVAPTEDTAFVAAGSTAVQGALQAGDTLLGHLGDLHLGTGGGGTRTAQAARSELQQSQLAFGGPMFGLESLVAQLPEAVARFGGWFKALGRFTSIAGSGGNPGFDSQGGGFLAGIDREVGDDLILGVAAGYSRTYVDESGISDSSIDTPRLAVYGSYDFGVLALDATVGYAHAFIHTEREISQTGQTASSDHGANEVSGALQASTSVALPAVTLMPRVGVQYVHLFEEGYSESGAPGFNLDVASRDTDSLQPFVGLSAGRSFTTADGTVLTPRLDVTYSHEMLDAAPASTVTVGGGSFTADGIEPSRDRVTLGGGLTAEMSGSLAVYGDYKVLLPLGNTFAQSVELGLRYRF